MSFLSRRTANLMTALGCSSLIAVAYFYMENYLFLVPCPLCYAQRFALGAIAVLAFAAAAFPGHRTASKLYGCSLIGLSLFGSALSLRHLYLQHTPKTQGAACGQDFYALVENTPFAETLSIMLSGSSDCGDIQWTWLGLSIPAWTLVAFICIGIWSLYFNIMRTNQD